MRMIRNGALAAGAMVAVAFLGACSDGATAPTSRAAFVPKSSFVVAVGDLVDATAVKTQLRVCKVGDANGSFTTANVESGLGGTGNPSVKTPLGVAVTECRLAVIDPGDAQQQIGDFFVVTEAAPAVAGTTQVLESCIDDAGKALDPCTVTTKFFINTEHGVTLTYRNTLPPPPPPGGCTYTKGWYRNHGKDNITGADGLKLDVEAAIFAATPGKPGNVTWTGSNDVLNLYQQYLAAIENGGLNGPQAVKDAIAKVDGASSVGGNIKITTTLSQAEVSAAINTLSTFNEGSFKGFPHCE